MGIEKIFVRVIAVIVFIVGILIGIGCIQWMLATLCIRPLETSGIFSGICSTPNIPGAIIYLIFSIIFIVLFFFIGINVWKFKKWARIVTIIFSIIGLVLSILFLINFHPISYEISYLLTKTNILQFIIPLIVSLIISLYLLFSKKAKKLFK